MNGKFIFTSSVGISAPQMPTAAMQFCKLMNLKFGISVSAEDGDAKIRIEKAEMPSEGFRLAITEEYILVTAGDLNGALYGLMELFTRVREEDGVVFAEEAEMEDAPYKEMRAVHLLPPAPDKIDEFKRVLDILCLLRFNTVMIWMGGILEMERHPRINTVWKKFSEIMTQQYPGGNQNMQGRYKYWKDSTGAGLAGGEILTKAQMRDIVDYARALGINIIPEIQSLSHSYYLALAYRELAEDPFDAFPDTYCPCNEKSYEIYFDVAEEFIEVFRPTMVLIGHDEVRCLGECERCKDKSGDELLAYEINRLYDFYKEKGIRICMWAEKLVNPNRFDGKKVAGGAVEQVNTYGKYVLPATYKAIEKMPKDILMIDWYHMASLESETDFLENDLPLIFGNVHGPLFGNWEERSKHALGALVSTWCDSTEESLAYNGMLLDLTFSSEMCWRSDFTASAFDSFFKKAVQSLDDVRVILRQTPNEVIGETQMLFRGDGEEVFDGTKAEAFTEETESFIASLGKLSGTVIGAPHVHIPANCQAEELIFVSAYQKPEKWHRTFFTVPGFAEGFVDPRGELYLPRWDAASFLVLYEDADMELVNMTYGSKTANVHMNWNRFMTNAAIEEIDEIDTEDGEETKPVKRSATYAMEDWAVSVPYYSAPAMEDGKTVYVYRWKNPHPEKTISKIIGMKTNQDTEQNLLLYAIAYK